MPRYARHLAEHTIVNPFPGIVKLERRLGHAVPVRIGSNEGPGRAAFAAGGRFGPGAGRAGAVLPPTPMRWLCASGWRR